MANANVNDIIISDTRFVDPTFVWDGQFEANITEGWHTFTVKSMKKDTTKNNKEALYIECEVVSPLCKGETIRHPFWMDFTKDVNAKRFNHFANVVGVVADKKGNIKITDAIGKSFDAYVVDDKQEKFDEVNAETVVKIYKKLQRESVAGSRVSEVVADSSAAVA